MNEIPLLEMKVRGMQHSIVTALSEYEAKLSSEIKEGVERAMSRNNIVALVEAETLAILRNEVLSAITYEAHKQLGPIVEGVVKAQVAKEAKRIWE